nr:hypothetical protein GCM10020093_032280 [Planobispora longispora]
MTPPKETGKKKGTAMELDINALEMLPAIEETQLRDCNSTCEVNIRTCFNSCNGSGYTY